MDFTIGPMTASDGRGVMDIFNHYVENSFAAYPETRLPYEAFGMFLKMCENHPSAVLRDRDGKITGFGFLRAHNPMPAFAGAAEISNFIHPGHTGRGLGKAILAHLEEAAKKKGITEILASISSLNPGSISFHAKNGFIECGRFRNIAKKRGQIFDTVWMQKHLEPAA